MLRRYVEQILNLYNYIDGIMVSDARGVIEYYQTFRPDVNQLKESDVIGKSVLEIYPNLTEETSSMMRVLRTGKPISNEFQTLSTFKGQSIRAVNTTMPIMDGDRIVGAVDVSRYVESDYERKHITLELKEKQAERYLYTLDDIFTASQQMMLLKERIRMIADTESSVLICGETGTGKELVAQSLHTSSHRSHKRFISQNCASIPANLLESILFGTVKGSYTGAETRPGLFELADGGTLFLDEINSMEISVQAKILKAIEEKQITRIGDIKSIPVDVKIVSAINQNPMDCIREGKLREDLFYRLSVVQLTMPPLRARHNDLYFLTNAFIKEFNEKMHRHIIGIDEEVQKIFEQYDWPGNVRELKNVIEGAFNVTDSGFIQKRDLPEYLVHIGMKHQGNEFVKKESVDFNDPTFSLDGAVKAYEMQLIREALNQTKNLTEAARKLRISKQTLNYKMNKYDL